MAQLSESFEYNGRRYVRPPVPVHFPVEAEVPESKLHFELRTALYAIVKLAFADRALIGCDQFVYWDPTDPSACVAPDLFVRIGSKDELFGSWKVWERGAPQVAVEITSDYDKADTPWQTKLEKYRKLGVVELVRFSFQEPAPLHIYDHVDGDLVERSLANAPAFVSTVLGAFWTVSEHPGLGAALRLARDPLGTDLLPTPEEARAADHAAALERVRELEEELRRRG